MERHRCTRVVEVREGGKGINNSEVRGIFKGRLSGKDDT